MKIPTIIFAFLFGCTNKEAVSPVETTTETNQPITEQEQEQEQSTPGIEDETIGEGSIEPQETAASRNRLRMNIDQLRSAMEQITGGVIWKSGNTDMWKKYQNTLGYPDYMETMSEDLSSSVIFQKFLGDAATYSCEAWIENEASATEPRFFVYADTEQSDETAIRTNLIHLRYLIHGQKNTAEDPIIDSYFKLYRLVLQRTNDSISAWNTVCVGFFTHPDFFTY